MNTASEGANQPIVVMFAYYFDPAISVGAVRSWWFYKYLRKMGYDCRVIAASAPSGTLPEGVTVIPDLIGRLLAAAAGSAPRQHEDGGASNLRTH